MKVYLPAIEGHVPPRVVRTLSTFLDFCYYVWRNLLNKSALETVDRALELFHHHCRIFQETGVREPGGKGFSVPRQHSMSHYRHLIQEYGAPNGLCSSITESKHIKAVKEPWRRSNHFEALGQMLITNQHLDKLAAARVDFEARGMLNDNILSAAIRELQDHEDNSGKDPDGDGNGTDDGSDTDDDIQMLDGPRVLNYVCLAKTPGKSIITAMLRSLTLSLCLPARKFPRDIYSLARYIQQPRLPLLTCRFLHFQLQDEVDPNIDDSVLPDLSNSSVSVFLSAIAMFYAPSDLSRLGGMHSERIRSTPCW